MDTCTKNAGKQFLVDMASRDFCEELQRLTKDPNINVQVQEMARGYFQRWALLLHAVDPNNLSFMREAYLECKRAGVHFPPSPKHVDPSVVDTNGPPDWTDSPVCVRCRAEFSFSVRQHHCRRCGRSYCHPCSSRELPLPEYGLPELVRVCEPCYHERTNGQIKREPILVHLPGEEHTRQPLDPDVEEAMKISKMEDKLRQARMASTAAEEEAQIAAAIAESLKETHARPRSVAPPIKEQLQQKPKQQPKEELFTEREKEMVSLFGKLVSQMLTIAKSEGAKSSDIDVEEDMQGTAADIKELKSRLLKVERSHAVTEFLDTIGYALMDFEELQILKDRMRIYEKYKITPKKEVVVPVQFPPLPEIKKISPEKNTTDDVKKVARELIPE